MEVVISLFFMFKNGCFPLFLGYVARYAPSKNKLNYLVCIASNRLPLSSSFTRICVRRLSFSRP